MNFISVILSLSLLFANSNGLSFDTASGTYDEVNVILTPHHLNASDCSEILENVKEIFLSASKTMFEDFNQRFGKINLRIPRHWSNDHCYKESHIKDHQPSESKKYDVILGPLDHLVNKGQAWTQQSLGCGQKGDFIYVPFAQNSSRSASLFSQWYRFYYGLFTNDIKSTQVKSGSKQDSFCLGNPPFPMIESNLVNPKLSYKRELVTPDFVVSREVSPKYVIVLENSYAMNVNNSWPLIRTALRKFINEDLQDNQTQLGLVLFNEAALIKNTVVSIGDEKSEIRTSLSYNLPTKFHLSHKKVSCVRCGIVKAIEALQTSGSTVGANIILISQGHLNVLSREDDNELTKLAQRHQLKLFTMPFVESKNNLSILFESLSYNTGANSFLIQPDKPPLDAYMDILDALREIQGRSETNAPALVRYETPFPLTSI